MIFKNYLILGMLKLLALTFLLFGVLAEDNSNLFLGVEVQFFLNLKL